MKVEIFSTSTCPYCQLAKDYLRKYDIPYQEIVIDNTDERQELYNNLGLEGNKRTVPQVFLIESNGTRNRVGGYTDLTQSDIVARHHIGDFTLDF